LGFFAAATFVVGTADDRDLPVHQSVEGFANGKHTNSQFVTGIDDVPVSAYQICVLLSCGSINEDIISGIFAYPDRVLDGGSNGLKPRPDFMFKKIRYFSIG
jgi:hypothetical protein